MCKQKYNPIIQLTLWKKYKKKAIRLGFIYGELWVRVMVFNATFNNISVVSWQSVLLVGVLGEHHRLAISHSHTVSHKIVSITSRLSEIRTHNVSGDMH